jgi:hypothetical protein
VNNSFWVGFVVSKAVRFSCGFCTLTYSGIMYGSMVIELNYRRKSLDLLRQRPGGVLSVTSKGETDIISGSH